MVGIQFFYALCYQFYRSYLNVRRYLHFYRYGIDVILHYLQSFLYLFYILNFKRYHPAANDGKTFDAAYIYSINYRSDFCSHTWLYHMINMGIIYLTLHKIAINL